MEKLRELIQGLGLAWEVFVIVMAIIAFMVWLDLFVGNRVRINANSLPGVAFEVAANWWSLQKNKWKAESMHFATGKRYWVIVISNRYYVINKYHRSKINRLLRRHNSVVMDINRLINNAIYHTK
jgi:hypothetical protein